MSDTKNTKKYINKYLKISVLMLIDVLFVNISAFLALFVHFDFNIHSELFQKYASNYYSHIIIFTLSAVAIFHAFRIYSSLWEFSSVNEAIQIVAAVFVFNILNLVYIHITDGILPVTFPITNALFLCFFMLALRFGYRFIRSLKNHVQKHSGEKVRTLIVGGGVAAATLIREIQNNPTVKNKIICVVDDDPYKLRSSIYGVKILGNRFSIPELVNKYQIEEIIIAIPSALPKNRHEIIEICQKTNCSIRTLPGIYQLVNGEVSIQKLRRVEIDDLLGRDSVKVDLHEITSYISGKTVLVTGGGGSIGSELCRQIAAAKPERLIVFDIYENNAYAIQQELQYKFPSLTLTVLIGSVRDSRRVDQIFEDYHPQLVFHAAAHKHVPLMENSPNEAIKNNVFGTYNTASAADKYGAEAFILISTDKAVNPTNVMGASKRMCEMVVQYFASRSNVRFAAVRFGNVLGSNGSVIPLFKKQIERGGPVTVTHPDIIRFFMTIPEAVSLVLQAGAYANNGEVFVLDMGDPVKIDDLARKMIKLSGLEPDVDIKIEYSGLREGEKLYEEILLSGEGLGKTPNNLIYIGRPQKKDDAVFEKELEELHNAFYADPDELRALMMRIVPEFHPEMAGVPKK